MHASKHLSRRESYVFRVHRAKEAQILHRLMQHARLGMTAGRVCKERAFPTHPTPRHATPNAQHLPRLGTAKKYKKCPSDRDAVRRSGRLLRALRGLARTSGGGFTGLARGDRDRNAGPLLEAPAPPPDSVPPSRLPPRRLRAPLSPLVAAGAAEVEEDAGTAASGSFRDGRGAAGTSSSEEVSSLGVGWVHVKYTVAMKLRERGGGGG